MSNIICFRSCSPKNSTLCSQNSAPTDDIERASQHTPLLEHHDLGGQNKDNAVRAPFLAAWRIAAACLRKHSAQAHRIADLELQVGKTKEDYRALRKQAARQWKRAAVVACVMTAGFTAWLSRPPSTLHAEDPVRIAY